MSPTDDTPDSLPRRSFLRIAGLTGAGWIVGTAGLTLVESVTGKLFMPVNDRLDALLLNPQKLVPELPISAIEPAALIENTFRFIPRIDRTAFRLTIDGAVNNPLSIDLTSLQQMPLASMVIRHVCVEGWAAIVQWGGVRLRDLIQLAQPKADVRYVYFQSADGYYESWDLASAMHPQTLLGLPDEWCTPPRKKRCAAAVSVPDQAGL